MMSEREVAKLAAEVLAGHLDPLVGCRQLVRRQGEVPAPVRASRHFSVLVGIESETDTFPLGEERKRWAPKALAQADEERDEYVHTNMEALRSALQGILALCGGS